MSGFVLDVAVSSFVSSFASSAVVIRTKLFVACDQSI